MAEAADNYNSSVSLAAVLIRFYLTRNQTFLRALEQPNVWPSTLFLDVQSAGSQPFYWEKKKTPYKRWKKYFPPSIITNFCSVEFDLKKTVIENYKNSMCEKTVCSFIIARRTIRQLVKMIIWLSSYYHVIILILCFKKYLVSLIDRQKRIPLVCIRFQISWNWYFIRTIYNKSGHDDCSLLVQNFESSCRQSYISYLQTIEHYLSA